MTVENISWSISAKECCRPRRGSNPRPPVRRASNWATEAGISMQRVKWCDLQQNIVISASACENVSSDICGQRWTRLACASAHSDQDFCCPLPESLYTTECINGEKMPGWDFTFVNNDVTRTFCACSKAPFRLSGPEWCNSCLKFSFRWDRRLAGLFNFSLCKTPCTVIMYQSIEQNPCYM